MGINRHSIAHSITACLLVPVVFLAMIPATGCMSQSTLAALTSTLGNSAANLAAIEGNITLSNKLTIDTAAAVKAVQDWKSGTNAQMSIEALNLVIDDIDLFPINTQYDSLVVLVMSTAEAIIALLPATSASQMHTFKTVHRATVPIHFHWYSGPKSDFTKTWNSIVSRNPALAPAAIK